MSAAQYGLPLFVWGEHKQVPLLALVVIHCHVLYLP